MVETGRSIAIFIYALSGGGAQRRTLTLANAFAQRGHRVDLVVIRSQDPPALEVSPAVRIVALETVGGYLLPLVVRLVRQRGIQTLASIPALARYLGATRPDVMMSAASHVHLVSVLAWRMAGRCTALVLRASNNPAGNLRLWPAAQRPVRLFLRWMASHIYPWADAVIAVSRGVAAEVVRMTGMPRDRVTVIYNPTVTPELYRKAAVPLDPECIPAGAIPVLLAAGKLKIQKDFLTLVRAFARVRAVRPARLVILGEGGQRTRIEALAGKLGVAADIDMPGHSENPFAWMCAASVFVLSSAWEGLPGVLIEALACGCPVVSTNCPSGPAEVLDGGRYGRLVPVGDHRALAEAIVATLDEPPASEFLRARAVHFSVDRAVDRYLEVLLGEIEARTDRVARSCEREQAPVAA